MTSIDLLETAAAKLGDLRKRVVFLGGATVALWITDLAARAPRTTEDVDVVAEVVTLAAYVDFQADLRTAGFEEDVSSGVICRWRHHQSQLILDAVPLETRLAGLQGTRLRPAYGVRGPAGPFAACASRWQPTVAASRVSGFTRRAVVEVRELGAEPGK